MFLRLRRACFDPYFYLYFTFVFTIICTFKKKFSSPAAGLFLRLVYLCFYLCFWFYVYLVFYPCLTLVFSFILLLCLPWFCFLPSIVSYQGTETFACRRNQLLLAAARRLCLVSYQALLLTKQPRRSLAAGTSSCSRSGQNFARVGIEYQTFLFFVCAWLWLHVCGCVRAN